MLAPRNRGAFATVAFGLLALASACSNGTEPTKPNDLCNSASALSLNVGQIVTPVDGSCVFVSGGSTGGQFALVAFNTDTGYARVASSINFTSSGASTVSTLLPSRSPSQSPSFNLLAGGSTAPELTRSYRFEANLRESERRTLTPLMSSARSWYRNRLTAGGALRTRYSPSFSTVAATWQVGDTVQLNTKTGSTFSDACQVPDIRTGRVVAITNNSIVVADTGNPTGGYTDAEYLTIGLQFDTVFVMDTTAFGSPTDIDNNGKIIMFFTRAVNELTPQGSTSIVGGFFYGRDLFPKQDSPVLGTGSGCPTSNVAEMFYLLVPDPNGVVNGNKFSHTQVQHLTNSTTAHEFQHLINASRRLYINTAATDFEVVWLNEGLSHVAEELLFYKQSAGLAPRMDIDSMAFTSQQNVDSYNYNESNNFGRLETYLLAPSKNAPYAPNDSLETRGATWSFLRYAADHRGSSDGDTWKLLVNSTTTGIANLQNVFGAGLTNMFRDWAIATIADDVPGAGSEWQQPSWDFPSMWVRLTRNSTKSYPLSTLTVGDGSPLSISLNGGGAAYVRFAVAANQVGSVKWTVPSAGVAMAIVRMK